MMVSDNTEVDARETDIEDEMYRQNKDSFMSLLFIILLAGFWRHVVDENQESEKKKKKKKRRRNR